jgi:hypothetical protein
MHGYIVCWLCGGLTAAFPHDADSIVAARSWHDCPADQSLWFVVLCAVGRSVSTEKIQLELISYAIVR